MRNGVNFTLTNMNSRDRVDKEYISCVFLKCFEQQLAHHYDLARIIIKDVKTKPKQKEIEETEPDSDLTRATSKLR